MNSHTSGVLHSRSRVASTLPRELKHTKLNFSGILTFMPLPDGSVGAFTCVHTTHQEVFSGQGSQVRVIRSRVCVEQVFIPSQTIGPGKQYNFMPVTFPDLT